MPGWKASVVLTLLLGIAPQGAQVLAQTQGTVSTDPSLKYSGFVGEWEGIMHLPNDGDVPIHISITTQAGKSGMRWKNTYGSKRPFGTRHSREIWTFLPGEDALLHGWNDNGQYRYTCEGLFALSANGLGTFTAAKDTIKSDTSTHGFKLTLEPNALSIDWEWTSDWSTYMPSFSYRLNRVTNTTLVLPKPKS